MELDSSVVAGRDLLCTNLPCLNQKRVKLQVIVAETARDGRPSGEVLGNERADDVLLETLLVIHYVVWDPKVLRHTARVVNVIDRTAATVHLLGHAWLPCKTSLIP